MQYPNNYENNDSSSGIIIAVVVLIIILIIGIGILIFRSNAKNILEKYRLFGSPWAMGMLYISSNTYTHIHGVGFPNKRTDIYRPSHGITSTSLSDPLGNLRGNISRNPFTNQLTLTTDKQYPLYPIVVEKLKDINLKQVFFDPSFKWISVSLQGLQTPATITKFLATMYVDGSFKNLDISYTKEAGTKFTFILADLGPAEMSLLPNGMVVVTIMQDSSGEIRTPFGAYYSLDLYKMLS